MPTRRCLYSLIAIAWMVANAQAIDAEIDRSIRWSDGVVNAEARPLLVTASDPPVGGDRLADPTDLSTSLGLDLSGVGRLFLDVSPIPGSGALCSGSLLEGGRSLLTAAHCVTDTSGDVAVIDGADGNSVTFITAAGPVTANFTAADISVHPQYSGNLLAGFDVAVIDLGSVQPSDVARYALNDGAVNEAIPHVAAGYGRSGDGGTGALLGAGQLRSGLNSFLTTGLPVGGISNLQTQLTADFDSGQVVDDAFGLFDLPFFGADIADPFNAGLGFGSDEVAVAPGDSGGPSFLLGTDGLVVTGVHSYGLRLELVNGDTSDIDNVLNSSFGEFYVDARVADPDVLAFIQSAAVPEPSTAWLVGFAMLCGRLARSSGSRERVTP